MALGTLALVILAYASRIHVDYGDSPSIELTMTLMMRSAMTTAH